MEADLDEPEADEPSGFVRALFRPVDIASLAVFRIAFGAIMFWEVWRYFDNGWIRTYYISRKFHFKYLGFGWVKAWPGDWMYVHFASVGVLALCVMVGLFYRVTSVLLMLGFGYWFLLDKTRYLNHLYLTLLLCFLMTLIPAHRAASVDAWLRPSLKRETAPAWSLWLMQAQFFIVYTNAGIAKIGGDWAAGAPMGDWLASRADTPLIGPLLAQPWATPFFAQGGMWFDLLIVPLLLWRPTRIPAVLVAVFFHVMNKWLFNIGIFPGLMLAATPLLFSPSWPRRICLFFAPRADADEEDAEPVVLPRRARRRLLTVLGVYLALQVLVPLRHFLYPGSVHWTEEGHCFAWHMKLRDKEAEPASFIATHTPTGNTWVVDQNILSTRQKTKVGQWPDMAHQYALYAVRDLADQGHTDVEIRVRTSVSLNGRPYRPLIDPEVDLASQPRSLWPADWILPLDVPLPEREVEENE